MQREYDAIAELHADHKDKDSKAGKKEPVMIVPINFKEVNEIYDSQKTKDSTNASKSAGNMKRAIEDQPDSFFGEQKDKKMTKRQLNNLFTKSKVKQAELANQQSQSTNELYE